MKILLTGSSGFIGAHLLKRLASIYGNKSICLLTSKPVTGFDCIIYKNHRNFDVGSYDLSDIDMVVHAGAFTPKNSTDANLVLPSSDNIFFTEQLLLLPFKKLKKIVNLSTLDVYASAEKISEESPVDPISLYGSSKLYCEKMIDAFTATNDVEYQTLRIGHVYGPGEGAYKKIIPITMSNVLDGKPVEIWGDGLDLRSFIYIDDVITAIVNAIERAPLVDIVNVVSGNSINIKDLVASIIKVSGESINVTYKDSAAASRNLIFDNSLLRSSLLETETDFMAGLTAEYNYMKAMHENNI